MIHEAFIHSGDDEFVAALAPFLAEGVHSGDAAVAVTTPARIGLLREALGHDAQSVAFLDSIDWYRRPGATLRAWRSAVDERRRDGVRFFRVIGELPFGGDADEERWARYESLVNRALADLPVWAVCAYDTRRLPDEVVADARRTHPIVSTADSRAPNADHFVAGDLAAPLVPGIERPDVEEGPSVSVSPAGDPIDLRKALVWPARRAGLAADVVEDLLLALEEIAGAVFASGRRSAVVRTGRAAGEWLGEVAAAGGTARFPLEEANLGFVVARLICDRVEVVDDERRLVVRLVFGAPRRDARQRLLTAAADLFSQYGVDATGVNAVIARAGVAKATFYSHFPSKDDLVRAWLEGPTGRWFEGVRAETDARTDAPAERLVLLFDVVAEWLEADGDAAPGRALASLDRGIEAYLRDQAAGAGLAHPASLASQLVVLFVGVIASARLGPPRKAAAAARAAAERLVASARS